MDKNSIHVSQQTQISKDKQNDITLSNWTFESFYWTAIFWVHTHHFELYQFDEWWGESFGISRAFEDRFDMPCEYFSVRCKLDSKIIIQSAFSIKLYEQIEKIELLYSWNWIDLFRDLRRSGGFRGFPSQTQGSFIHTPTDLSTLWKPSIHCGVQYGW